MKKVITGAAVSAVVVVAAVAAARRFGPAIRERAMNKCHQMMGKCQEMFSQQPGRPGDTGCMSTVTPGPERAAAGEHEPAEATQAT